MKELLLELTGITTTDPLFHYILDYVLIGFAVSIILMSFQMITRLFRFR